MLFFSELPNFLQQTYINTYIHTEKQIETQTLRKTDTKTDRQTDRQTYRHKGARTQQQKEEQTHRHTYRKSERQEDRPTDIQTTEAETEIHKSSSVQKIDIKFCFEWFLDRPASLVGYIETLVKNTMLSERRSRWFVHILNIHSSSIPNKVVSSSAIRPFCCNSISNSSPKCLFFLP